MSSFGAHRIAVRDADRAIPGDLDHPTDQRLFACYLNGVDSVLKVTTQFTDHDWALPTSCTEWVAADIAGHLLATAADANLGLELEPTQLMTIGELARHNATRLASLPRRRPERHLREFRRQAMRFLGRAGRVLDRTSYKWGERQWTVRDNVGVLAVEWHVHAWDLATATGGWHTPADPEMLAAAFAGGMAYMALSSDDDDAWLAVLTAAGRDPGDPLGMRSLRER